jgi:nickel-dependent lactate racemase
MLDAALDYPIAAPALSVAPGSRVTLIVSDATRNEPRSAFVEAVRARLPADVHLTLAIATGTHGPTNLDDLGLPGALRSDVTIVNHDGHRPDDLIDLGTTTRGTPVRVHRCVVETDLVIATGCIRPHYFAGFGAGAKAIFPGLGEARAIRKNHELKLDPCARSGIVVGNPCREDLEEAARMIPARAFLLDAICDADEHIRGAVAGDIVEAFRHGVALARPTYEAAAAPAPLVIASDALPVTASLYQAAKIAAAAAPFVEPDGTLVIVAQCPEGIGPLETVNEAIFRIGVLPRLPPNVRLLLVSDLDEAQTNRTLLAYGHSVDRIIASTAGRILVLPHASKLIPAL